ncbi:hypothetical protein CfE428DRAFT_2399 [Chthoniobacter flavus Ellin428]|uniref:Uncharacterized protein n=1 Tax=Chthoniobacter flavus Ellin428 TaxID=497964 RepID=B4D0E8_9BACT|nr:hypothetical protein [Chthoniobacter flavus]EDY19810.1 hypothetical protein CfE428DRAFT_2399 [Chthoniobacter flavus Ellin428]TCO91916.1 hypothetical protein EV701_107197 [Chthoniobacter flavus]
MTEEQLSALLRIKRFEQPPPQYFDQLLQNIHRRQRSELLHRPLWKIAAERMQTFFSEHSMSHLSYAGALASVVVVGIVGIGFLTSGGSLEPVGAHGLPAIADSHAPRDIAPADNAFSQKSLLAIEMARPSSAFGPSALPTSAPLPTAQNFTAPGAQQPRYVIDARPASYEPAPAYSF